MESDTRNPRPKETGQNMEKSPAGSVKRARQRAAAGMPSEQQPPPQMPSYPTPLQVRSPRRSPQQNSSPSQGSSPIRNAPPASIRPPVDFSRPRVASGRQDQTTGRGQIPQRPPRPQNAPTMPQSDRPEHTQQNEWDDGFRGSSGSGRPPTTSTGSTLSSTDSIPDFPSISPMPPAPSFQPPPRRNLGPPPSARKGGSSYYSNTSFVPPIPEEMSDAHSSFASSHVMPESWNDGPLEYYMGPGIEEEDEDTQGGNSGRGSSAGDHDDSSGLVRRGSHGRPQFHPLDTLQSGDESERGSQMGEVDEQWRTGAPGTDPIGRHNFRGNAQLDPQNLYSGYMSDASFLDSPRNLSRAQSPMPNLDSPTQQGMHQYFGSPPPSSPMDPRVGQIIGHLEKGGALSSSGTASPSSPSIMSEKGFRRPPRLNLEDSKAHGRASASSLPELIRRATKLASNLDRGKTASRAGMLDLLNAKEKEREREKAARGDGSISDILAAFPSPSPTTQRPSGWPTPSPHGKSALSRAQTPGYSSSTSQKRKRKCCGLPVWAFVLLIIILLLLIAAAVIIPITLVVIPHEHKNRSPDIDSCQTSLPCANGGTSVVISSKCRCICSNGFLGSSCNTAADAGCTSTNIPGPDNTSPYQNATFGESISPVFDSAATNFSIPLMPYKVLSLFSATNLSCASENALMTLNQKSQRRDTAPIRLRDTGSLQGPIPMPLNQVLAAPTKTKSFVSRILHARGSAQTTNGIIFAAAPGTPDVPQPTASSSSSPTSTINESPITQQVLDFSRTAVLFIFQETSSLAETTTALDKLQVILSGGKTFDATQTSAGGNITVDLTMLTVGFGNGTLYGGRGT